MRSALFLDLDGTVVVPSSGNKFPKGPNDWKFIDGVVDVIKEFKERDYLIMIVSNQGGIELGKVIEPEVNIRMDKVAAAIKKEIGFQPYYRFCPKYNYDYNRKPFPGMAYQCAMKFDLDLKKCIMVGDMKTDAEFAQNAGMGDFIHAKDFRLMNIEDVERVISFVGDKVGINTDNFLESFNK